MIKLIALVLVIVGIGAVEGGLRFLIKHKSSGTYWHPHDTQSDTPENGHILTFHGHHRRNVWEFVHYENEWGYIKHAVSSNKYVWPHKGYLKPVDYTVLTTYDGHSATCLFAFDANRHVIIHKAGKIANPNAGGQEAQPPNKTPIVLIGNDINDGNKWLFVNPDNPYQEVELYSKPTMNGYWRHIFSAINPRVSRTEKKTITVGRSNSTENTSSFKWTWEVNVGGSIGAFNFGTSFSVEKMFSKTTRQTWTTQTTFERSITVKQGGPSVVVWQYVFNVQQYNRLSEFGSDIIVDTDSLNKTPNIDVLSIR